MPGLVPVLTRPALAVRPQTPQGMALPGRGSGEPCALLAKFISNMPLETDCPAGQWPLNGLGELLQGVVQPVKVGLDLQLTNMASALHRLFAVRLGNGRQNSKARALFRGFVKAVSEVAFDERRITGHFGRRANRPFLIGAGNGETDIGVPRLRNRQLQTRLV